MPSRLGGSSSSSLMMNSVGGWGRRSDEAEERVGLFTKSVSREVGLSLAKLKRGLCNEDMGLQLGRQASIKRGDAERTLAVFYSCMRAPCHCCTRGVMFGARRDPLDALRDGGDCDFDRRSASSPSRAQFCRMGGFALAGDVRTLFDPRTYGNHASVRVRRRRRVISFQ